MNSLRDLRRQLVERKYFFLLVIILCVGVYLSILDNAFVSDDVQGILENPQIGNLSLTLKKFDLNVLLKDLVFLAFGKSPLAYHVVNLVLHILATILVYFFVLILTEDYRLSSFATLLFALHPIHTEAVTWISGRGYVLYSVFFLLSFIFYHFSQPLPALIFYTLSLFSSAWALPLLIVFPLYGWYLRGKKFDWGFYLALLAVAGLNLFLVYRVGGITSRALRGASVGGTRDYTITMPHSLTQYLYLVSWPIKLSFYRENDLLTSTYILFSRVIASIFIFILPLFFFLRKMKLALFFLLFFLASISLSLSPIKVGWYVAERYLYLGSISFCVLLAFLLLEVGEKLSRPHLALILLLPILLLYFARTFIRNDDWQSRESLWTVTVRDSPRSPRAHNNLGDVYGRKGDWKKAVVEFQTALKLKPNYAAPYHNLGIAYLNLGDFEIAKKYLLRAIELSPRYDSAYYVLGIISLKEGNSTEAQRHWEHCLEINPRNADCRWSLESLR